MKTFSELGLDEPLQRAVRDAGYEEPTPIQERSIPHLLAGRDLLGCARTGTGKTAAFALPILQRLTREPRSGVAALVLVPTRELASQVGESFRDYGRHGDIRVAVVYGGVTQNPQVRALREGVDVLVATPGRLVDLINQGHARLDTVRVLVLDEADHMLDLGFLPDVRRIIGRLPKKRQTLLFSATMPEAIASLADTLLVSPAKVTVTPPASTVELVDQSAYIVPRLEKPELLAALLSQKHVESALVFTRTKRGADRVAKRLADFGITAHALHGDKAQSARERILRSFREGTTRVLVATDVAARGIDIDDISLVVNYELPHVPETYVHRIGRTGRAGAQGIAVSLVGDDDERDLLRAIEKTIKRKVPIADATEVPAAARVDRPRRGFVIDVGPQHRRDQDPRRRNAPQRARGSARGGGGGGGRAQSGGGARGSHGAGARPRAQAPPSGPPSAHRAHGREKLSGRGVERTPGPDTRASAAAPQRSPAPGLPSRRDAARPSHRSAAPPPRSPSPHAKPPARGPDGRPDSRAHRPEGRHRGASPAAPKPRLERRPEPDRRPDRAPAAPEPLQRAQPGASLAGDAAVLKRRKRRPESP